MKRIINIFLVLALVLISFYTMAQKAKKEAGKPKAETAPVKLIPTYLGASEYRSGQISKKDFDAHLKEGLKAKDSLGNGYKVDGFTFSYSERNLYEDSVGNLMVLTDYLSEFCPGDTISPAVANNIFYKTKPGDTAYFDNIKVLMPDGRKLNAKPMKFILTK